MYGNKGSGVVFVWGRCEDVEEQKWKVQRLDVLVHRTGQRWKFYETEAIEEIAELVPEASEAEQTPESAAEQRTEANTPHDPMIYLKAERSSR